MLSVDSFSLVLPGLLFPNWWNTTFHHWVNSLILMKNVNSTVAIDIEILKSKLTIMYSFSIACGYGVQYTQTNENKNKYGIGTINCAQRDTLRCLHSNSCSNVDLHKHRSDHMNKCFWGSGPPILNLFQVWSHRAENCNSISHSCPK